ncbi:recombinase, phage RecT family [Finegoldia magna SY403409CC001050417]|uniref:Recombinase RecT n=1 Tax=Finegoldia magna TaxID=1260 RepID=A0A7D4JJ58_FINMA|nr:recombinase RecT [Finegoldia magna]EGS34227.1 recombinase, phage RecT family [Finegoldia magna SY403409CC001050417]QKH79713.1 recombinase RecT [Finegoldia magna]QKH79760.1 recombinase RecT [Finegoldia magna]
MSNELAKQEKTIVDSVQKRIAEMQNSGSIELPNNYSVGNALKSAYLILQETQTSGKKPVLQACTQESIANSLLDMATQGLNPSKNQCYFIAYGNKLTMERGYLGTIALTKRIKGVKDVKGYAVYKDDKFELGFDILTGKQKILEFCPGLNRDPKNLVGAFALILGNNEILHTEYMDINQIHKAWEQGSMKGNSGAHKNFPDQMAIKTVINRACKYYVSTSDDSDKIAEFMSKSVEDTDRELEEDKKEFANKEVIEIEEIPEIVDVETREIIEAEIEDTNESQAPF